MFAEYWLIEVSKGELVVDAWLRPMASGGNQWLVVGVA